MTWHLDIENVGEGHCLPNMQSICVIYFSKDVKYVLTQSELRRNPGARKAQSSEWQMESGKAVNSQGGAYCQTYLWIEPLGQFSV